jgi:RimJ/RimL family protein N-acetyltransferase
VLFLGLYRQLFKTGLYTIANFPYGKALTGEKEGLVEMDIDIRLWSDKDLPLLEKLLGDPVMTEHIGGPESPEKIRERHARYCASTQAGDEPQFVIVIEPEKVAAGWIGYWEKEWNGQLVLETGWSVLPEFQGQGVASRAANLLVERARKAGRHRFLHAYPAVDNGPSNAICHKVGFTLQGAVDFEYPKGHFMRCNDWCLTLF